MKFNLILLAVLVLLGGCGDAENKPDLSNTAPEEDPLESAVEWSKLQDRNGDCYIPNTDKPYSGWAKKTFENGQVEMLTKFTAGTVTRLQQWQKNGIPKLDIGYTKGKVSLRDVPLVDSWRSNFTLHDGLQTIWYENGQKKLEQNWKDGKEDGPYTGWHENGQKMDELNYKDGALDGLGTSWHENGQKIRESICKDGKLISFKRWKQNGEKCPITNVINGTGVIFSYKNGKKVGEEFYKEGKRNGLARSWNEDGELLWEQNYKDGKEVD